MTDLNDREREIVDEAIAAFQQATRFVVEKATEWPGGERQNKSIRLKAGNRTVEYRVNVRAVITDAVVGRIAHHIKDEPGKWLITTRHVSQSFAKKLRDLDIQFIDTAGNAYINEPPTFIFIQGNKPQRQFLSVAEAGSLGRAGLCVVFALLSEPDLLNATYRDIARRANVALGTLAGVIKDLRRQGFIVEMAGEGRRLTKKKILFDKWTTAYAEILRPKRLIGRFTADRLDFWQDLNLLSYGGQWGGEVAAVKMTRHLKPEIVTIYTHRPVNDLVLALKLRRDDHGNVELRDRFWEFGPKEKGRDLVRPLLVYADLLATGDARNIETAKMIYNDYLQRHFE